EGEERDHCRAENQCSPVTGCQIDHDREERDKNRSSAEVSLEEEQENSQSADDRSGEDEGKRFDANRQPVGKIGGEKNNEHQFQRFRGLKIKSTAPKPQARTEPDRVCAEEQGECNEQKAAGEKGVFVFSQKFQRGWK